MSPDMKSFPESHSAWQKRVPLEGVASDRDVNCGARRSPALLCCGRPGRDLMFVICIGRAGKQQLPPPPPPLPGCFGVLHWGGSQAQAEEARLLGAVTPLQALALVGVLGRPGGSEERAVAPSALLAAPLHHRPSPVGRGCSPGSHAIHASCKCLRRPLPDGTAEEAPLLSSWFCSGLRGRLGADSLAPHSSPALGREPPRQQYQRPGRLLGPVP